MADPDFGNERVSFHWGKFLKKAGELLENVKELIRLLEKATRLLDNVKNNSHIKNVFSKLTSMFRLAKAYANGSYRKTPWKTLLLVVAAIIYFVSPIDAIADFIPVLGFADDASVIAIVFNVIKPILDDFLAWEKSRRN